MDKKNKYKAINLERFKAESKPTYVTAKTDKKVTRQEFNYEDELSKLSFTAPKRNTKSEYKTSDKGAWYEYKDAYNNTIRIGFGEFN